MMRKFTRFIMLLLLVFGGVTTLQAQLPVMYETVGDGSDIDIAALAAANEKIVLKGSDSNGKNYSTNYLDALHSSYSTTLSEGSLYVFVATGKEVDGFPTYYLKNDSTGMYLKADPESFSDEEDEGIIDWVSLTADINEAFEFTALRPAADGAADEIARNRCSGNGATPDPNGWVFAYAGRGNVYLGAYYAQPFYSTYIDTDQWVVLRVKVSSPLQTLLAAYNRLGAFNPELYVAGNQPGNTTQETIDAMKAAADAIDAASNNADMTLEEANALYQAYKEAKEAADAARAELMPAAGKYYYFVCKDGNLGMYDNGTTLVLRSGFVRPSVEEANSEISAYIWQLEDAGDGKFFLKNFATGRYNGTNNGPEQNGAATVQTTETPGDKLGIVLNESVSQAQGTVLFNIIEPGGKGYNRAGSVRVCYWGANDTDIGNWWYVYAVEPEIIDALAAEVEHARITEQLTKLYGNATFSKHKGLQANSTVAYDFNYDGAIVLGDAAFSSNNEQEAAANVNDGDLTTCYSSGWGGTQPVATDYVYVQVDLGQDVSNFDIKLSPKFYRVAPIRAEIVASTDGVLWKSLGEYLFDYMMDVPTGVADLAAQPVGRLSVLTETPVRHIRLVCKTNPDMIAGPSSSTYNFSMTGGFPAMVLRELHIWNNTATKNEDLSQSFYLQVSEDVRAEFEKQLAAAQTELATNAATAETYEALKAAYAALLAEMPDPQELLDAVDAARAAIEGLPVGTELGYYDEDKLNELTVVLEQAELSAEEGVDRATIDAVKASIDAALDAFLKSLILPTEGGVYVLRCGTSSAANATVRHSMVYSNGNSETAALLQMRQIANPAYDETLPEDETNPSKIDAVSPLSDLRLLWQVTYAREGRIAIRNLATGYYIGDALGNGENLPNVATEVIHDITTSGTPGLFYINAGVDSETGKTVYMNFSGSAAKLIGWSAPDGNCSFIFEEADLSSASDIKMKFPVSASEEGYTIITLPLNVEMPEDFSGVAYEVLGQVETADGYALSLRTYVDDETWSLKAGVPYLFQPSKETATNGEVEFYVTDENGERYADEDILSATYNFVPQSSNALVGTIGTTVVNEGPIVTFTAAGKANIPNAQQLWEGVTVANNSGYVVYVENAEEGDALLPLSKEMSSGIAGTVISADADVYTLSGIKVRQNVKASGATKGLPAGIYVVGGRKVLVK